MFELEWHPTRHCLSCLHSESALTLHVPNQRLRSQEASPACSLTTISAVKDMVIPANNLSTLTSSWSSTSMSGSGWLGDPSIPLLAQSTGLFSGIDNSTNILAPRQVVLQTIAHHRHLQITHNELSSLSFSRIRPMTKSVQMAGRMCFSEYRGRLNNTVSHRDINSLFLHLARCHSPPSLCHHSSVTITQCSFIVSPIGLNSLRLSTQSPWHSSRCKCR